MACGARCCAAGELCVGGAQCAPDRGGPCTSDDECGDDSRCESALARCVGYAPMERSASCRVPLPPGVVRTRVQCEWTGPPAGDPHPAAHNASSIPLVVDFRIDRGPDDPPRPSIVVVTGAADGGAAVIRVIDGTTCAHQATLAEHGVTQGTAPAVGDINGDGRPEIIAAVADGGLAAWTYDPVARAFRVLWRNTDRTVMNSGGAAISLADLDDDGVPEILAGAVVYGADGALRSAAAGLGDRHCGGPGGGYIAPPVVADVDLDGAPELVQGTGVWGWDRATNALVREPYSMAGGGIAGPIALADFGEFPGRAGDAPGRPEIASIQLARARVLTLGGDVVFGPVTLPGGQDGGNPTVADFDGDGRAEFATAGLTTYAVFDPDCAMGSSPRGGACASGRTDGILWARPIQENSCAIMGSTVFDFEGDGAAEVVYADECFARIYSGRDGAVLWSRPRSSATWIEGPTVADTDGDFHAEMVLTATDAYRPTCPALDPQFGGQRCAADVDCPTAASRCVDHLCRCTADADCGDPDLACAAPLAMAAGGNVCRARFRFSHGVRVYSDVADRWAGSRAIWNQHAYAVTNVDDDGRIPRSSAARRNWQTAGLNNFRQNVQGEGERAAATDLTVRGTGAGRDCAQTNPALPLTAQVCNRGTLGTGAGLAVAFYDRDPRAGGREVCRATTRARLAPGECAEVGCTWMGPPLDTPLEVHVRADPDGVVGECREANNHGTLRARCPPAPG